MFYIEINIYIYKYTYNTHYYTKKYSSAGFSTSFRRRRRPSPVKVCPYWCPHTSSVHGGDGWQISPSLWGDHGKIMGRSWDIMGIWRISKHEFFPP